MAAGAAVGAVLAGALVLVEGTSAAAAGVLAVVQALAQTSALRPSKAGTARRAVIVAIMLTARVRS